MVAGLGWEKQDGQIGFLKNLFEEICFKELFEYFSFVDSKGEQIDLISGSKFFHPMINIFIFNQLAGDIMLTVFYF